MQGMEEMEEMEEMQGMEEGDGEIFEEEAGEPFICEAEEQEWSGEAAEEDAIGLLGDEELENAADPEEVGDEFEEEVAEAEFLEEGDELLEESAELCEQDHSWEASQELEDLEAAEAEALASKQADPTAPWLDGGTTEDFVEEFEEVEVEAEGPAAGADFLEAGNGCRAVAPRGHLIPDASLEGSNRLKRLLEEDARLPGGASAKKRRVATGGLDGPRPIEAMKINQLLRRWQLEQDVASRYVLENLRLQDLQDLLIQKYAPRQTDSRMKSAAEQISLQAISVQEAAGPSGGILDPVAVVKFRWKLADKDESAIRALNHKELRHVIQTYDGTRTIHEVVQEAAAQRRAEGSAGAAPRAPGISTLGRFLRLELIDPSAKALVLGDANLTFSLELALHRQSLGHSGQLVATTFETIETLRERYAEIDDTIRQLGEVGAQVWHGVDCTRLADNAKFRGLESSFGAAYYNFPHAGAVSGFFDSHPFVRWRHENLMQLFFRAITVFLADGASVKVSSNCNATGVRYSDIMRAAQSNEFVHVETVPFNEWSLRHYNRSYGDRRDAKQRVNGGEQYRSQNADRDMVYSFCFKPSGAALPKLLLKRPPSCSDILACTEACRCGFICQAESAGPLYAKHHFKPFQGSHERLEGAAKEELVSQLCRRFLAEISGHHVG
ncbi:unnamed protein product [Polarella glacialis]|uniref:25S rRNA (uridine-N(3))-methyltransferase BMT5-like domain-containing protein n=1 Tax=Polarella glacialis TaxID=89957 RepID=A0A813EM85_POLGL|nr:unnamed protein product [Polarella glacialis]